ncbi:MAG: HEAT repeat domain-containing protein [Isosphaeraceae bacterium]
MLIANSRRRGILRAGAPSLALLALVSATSPFWSAGVRADTIMLRGGGQVEGKVVPDPLHQDRVCVWLLQGRNPLSLEKKKIVEIVPKPGPLDAYVIKREKAGQTAQAQYDLGVWCAQNKLGDLARAHYESAIAFDKSFEPAHKKLGHVLHRGYWLTRDELSAVQGLVKYKGRWISADEKTKRDHEDQLTAAQGNWVRQIRLLREALLRGKPDRQREAETQLMAIRDPDAVKALVRVLANDDPQERILLAHVLAMIPGPLATGALVNQLLAENQADVRAAVYEKVQNRDDPAVVRLLIRALSSSNIRVINRAAWALGNLHAQEAVPRLIAVLVTTEERMVIATQSAVNQGPISAIAGPDGPLTPIAVNQSSMAVMTPPVIAPGVVARGVYSAPWYDWPPGVGFNVGGQIAATPDVHVATFQYRNAEVLSALEKLTLQDFGYDVESWRTWVSRSFNPDPKPSRRVPQP